MEGEPGAGGFFSVDDEAVRITGRPIVTEQGDNLQVDLPIAGEQSIRVTFGDRTIGIHLIGKRAVGTVGLAFRWDPAKAALVEVTQSRAAYRWEDIEYALNVGAGLADRRNDGFVIASDQSGTLLLSLVPCAT
jgi:hypothetical protein